MRLIPIKIALLILILLPASSAAQTDDFFAQGMRPDFVDDLNQWPDVPVYTMDLRLEPDFEQATLAGSVEILYTNTTPDTLNEIVLRLYANLESFGGLASLENVTVNGVAVEPSLPHPSVVRLNLPTALAPGEQATLQMDYTTQVFYERSRLYRQYSYFETELALASALPLLSVYEPGRGWWENFAHPQGDAVYSESGNFDVSLTVPDYLTVIASGTLVDESLDGEWRTLRYAAPLMRDFAIMASPNYNVLSDTFGDTQVNIYYLPGKEAGAALALVWTLDSLEAFTTLFGPYTHNELDVVETYTLAGGIEYPGLIVVAANFWEPGIGFFEHIVVHEVAHQWWYSMVGNDQTLYPWLDEALTEYVSARYYGFAYDQDVYDATIASYRQQFVNFEGEDGDNVVGLPPDAYNTSGYGALVYRKGAYFFDQLATVVMDEATFDAALQIYLEQYRYDVATPFDLQTILEDVSGQELDDWFLEWIGYSNS